MKQAQPTEPLVNLMFYESQQPVNIVGMMNRQDFERRGKKECRGESTCMPIIVIFHLGY